MSDNHPPITPTQNANLDRIAQSTVGFLVQRGDHLTSAGSGTIVSIQGTTFFVTAGHVAAAVKDSRGAAIITPQLSRRPLRPIEFRPDESEFLIHWDGHHSPAGPDIGAILLPPDITGHVAQLRVVYNLDRRANLLPDMPPMNDLVLAGFPLAATMMTMAADDEERRDKVSLTLVSGERGETEIDDRGFDRFDFLATYLTGAPPETFEGVSGGGIWCLDADNPNTIPLLGGMAYYQGDRRTDGNRILTCAGSRSLYAKLMQEAAQAWVRG